MTQEKIHFDNGANYQKSMGIWSELVGSSFLDWLALPNNLDWLDDGCGNGDFTELVIERCLPKRISGIDLSSELLNYARTRRNCQLANFQLGNAMNLPYGDNSFDVVVMALVIFFLPDPAKGLSEMVRVVRSGGCVASYTWDLQDALYPLAPVNEQLFAMGHERLLPPNVNTAKSNNLHDLWVGAQLENIQVKAFTVDQSFDNFEDYWVTVLLAPNINSLFNAMTPNDQRTMLDGVRKRLPVSSNGKIVVTAKANAIRGQVP